MDRGSRRASHLGLLSAYRWQVLLSVHNVNAPLWDLIQLVPDRRIFQQFPAHPRGRRCVSNGGFQEVQRIPVASLCRHYRGAPYRDLWAAPHGVAAVTYPRFHEVRSLGIALFSLAIAGLVGVLLFYGSEGFPSFLKTHSRQTSAKISGKLAEMIDAFWHFSTSKGVVLYAFVLGIASIQRHSVLLLHRARSRDELQLEASIVMPLLICIQLLPLTPNGIGVREFSYIYLLQPFEFRKPGSRLLDLGLRSDFAYGIIGGLLYLTKNKMYPSHYYSRRATAQFEEHRSGSATQPDDRDYRVER